MEVTEPGIFNESITDIKSWFKSWFFKDPTPENINEIPPTNLSTDYNFGEWCIHKVAMYSQSSDV